jgi:hypothetical protein
MAIRRQAVPKSQPLNQQIFAPKDTLGKFSKIFPMLYVGFGVVMVALIAAAYFLNQWVLPLMGAIPMASVIATGTFATKMQNTRVVIDGDRIRIVEGKFVKLNLLWHQITRLTIRQVNDGQMYELWAKDKATPLMADFFVDGDKLLKAVSARTSLAWEKL